jgi:hypothetical protein
VNVAQSEEEAAVQAAAKDKPVEAAAEASAFKKKDAAPKKTKAKADESVEEKAPEAE